MPKSDDYDFWSDSDFVTEYCQRCDCILRYDEGDICCWCLERIQKEDSNA
jgi:hypothetical protein